MNIEYATISVDGAVSYRGVYPEGYSVGVTT